MTASREFKANIIVLNYRGAELLPQCLPSIVEASERSRYPTRVSVLNNPSSIPNDGLDYVRAKYPEIHIAQAPKNRVLCSYNDFLFTLKERIVILLNNDIRVAPDFVNPLIQKFEEDPMTFLVAPRVMSFDGQAVQAGRSKAGVRLGFFWCRARYQGYEKDVLTPSETYSSGFGAFDREKFLELDGYDERYLPGIMEDVDLCYRAQKAGYHHYYEPTSVVYHMGQVSFKKKFGTFRTAVIANRNNFVFMWKNFRGFSFWFGHLFFLPLRLVFSACRGHWAMILGFWEALKMTLPLKKREAKVP